MIIIQWEQRSEWEWQAEALYVDDKRVSPRWEVWRSGSGNWIPRVDSCDLYMFACDNAQSAKDLCQELENARPNRFGEPASANNEGALEPVTPRQLAKDVLSVAADGGMPDSFWLTDSRILRAAETLRWAPEVARSWAQEQGN